MKSHIAVSSNKNGKREEFWDSGKRGGNISIPEKPVVHLNFRTGVTTEFIDVRDNPDDEYQLGLPPRDQHIPVVVPCEKTETEIDKLWEYNKIMGRGTLPRGIE